MASRCYPGRGGGDARESCSDLRGRAVPAALWGKHGAGWRGRGGRKRSGGPRRSEWPRGNGGGNDLVRRHRGLGTGSRRGRLRASSGRRFAARGTTAPSLERLWAWLSDRVGQSTRQRHRRVSGKHQCRDDRRGPLRSNHFGAPGYRLVTVSEVVSQLWRIPHRPAAEFADVLAVSDHEILAGEVDSPDPGGGQQLQRLLRLDLSQLDVLAQGW